MLEPLRRRAIARLAPQRGETVLDVGCGTGDSFPLLEAAVGPGGRLIGIDQSPEMLARARQRVAREGWFNVTLVESPAAAAPLAGSVDRILVFYVHDVMRSPEALDHVLAPLRPAGRLVAAGPRWAPAWAAPLNLWIWYMARPYHTTFEGFRQPWSHLATRLRDLDVERTMYGRGYVAYIAAGTAAPAVVESGDR